MIPCGTAASTTVKRRLVFNVGNSPQKKKTRFYISSGSPKKISPVRRKLTGPVKYHRWSDDEDRALVEFVSIAKTDPTYGWESNYSEWPSFNASHFIWEDAAKHIKESTASTFLLSNIRVRSRTINTIRVKYGTVQDAEKNFGLSLSNCLKELDNKNRQKTVCKKIPGVNKCTQTRPSDNETTYIHQHHSFDKAIPQLSNEESLKLANSIFSRLAVLRGIEDHPGDFITLSLNAMALLKENQKPNLLYKFAFILGTKNNKSGEPLLPINRMPFGLISYQIQFFSCTNIMQITVPDDYAKWHETMCAEFPTRFNRLFRGPMWSSVPISHQKDPLTARVNVAAPSLQWVEKRTSKSDFSATPVIQVAAIKQLKETNLKSRFWLKVDACDVKPALLESMKGEWNGDVDLGDDSLKELREKYNQRQKSILIPPCANTEKMKSILLGIETDLNLDVKFLTDGLERADETYRIKFNCVTTSKEQLKSLCWERVEYNTLLQQAQSFKGTINNLVNQLTTSPSRTDDVTSYMRNLRSDFHKYTRNVYMKRRQPATHILVILLSDERRISKPYAIPVQYIPFHSFRDQYIRDITNRIKQAMVSFGLKPVGTVTDGEFSSLRTQGETRPLHLMQIVHDARESVSKQSEATLLSMLIKVGENAMGRPVVARPNKYISDAKVNELHTLRHDMSLEDAVTFMRGKLVPPGYAPYSFRPNTPESFLDKLRSLVGTYIFRGIVEEYEAAGIPFTTHVYCPEIDPITGDFYQEREDHCHILKRIAKHTREGGPKGFKLNGLDDAVMDSTTGLTQAALTGERKQSVQDAERLLSYHVATFLRDHNFETEAKYIEIVAGWHEAADGRGLKELDRCRKNYAMLNMILDDWMPWHRNNYDFSTIDINRPIKGICGFSRETVLAVTTNIEGLEFRRRQIQVVGYEEHPRAGSTDDVEAFFALVHRFLGNTFTLKQFKYSWQKLVREFCKRLNPELPFYYYTLNERYKSDDVDLPSFNSMPDYDDDDDDDNHQNHPLRLRRLRLNRREDASIFVPGRCFLPTRNKTTIRQRLFKPIAALPQCGNYQV